jgi:lipoate-protein ligase A
MTLHLIHCQRLPIFEQLQLEEALLREDARNWCLINEGSPPAIVMGISGKKELLVNADKLSRAPIPLIKRFSGGGTVVVDEDTLFITFIFQKEAHPFAAYPEPIMRWSAEIYGSMSDLELRENDYVLGNKKCGGNAQYIKKDRWLHHTSFLWDFKQERMDYLLHPHKTPAYREGRTHADFLCTLSEHFPDKNTFLDRFKEELSKRYQLQEMPMPTLLSKDGRTMLLT